MAASRITRKRTNASSSGKAKKFPPPSSSTKSVHEVAILKNEQKEEDKKRDEKPGCDEITDPKRVETINRIMKLWKITQFR
jgi:hypothetical protein